MGEEKKKTTIELTSEQAGVFHFFHEHFVNIKKLRDKGVFSVRSKTVTLHIDHEGNIQEIDAIIRLS